MEAGTGAVAGAAARGNPGSSSVLRATVKSVNNNDDDAEKLDAGNWICRSNANN